MAKPKVYATHPLFDEARQILDDACEMQYWTNEERPPRDEVLRNMKDKEGLICLLTEKVNEEFLRAAPKLRIAANVAVGYDNIDVAACTRRMRKATPAPTKAATVTRKKMMRFRLLFFIFVSMCRQEFYIRCRRQIGK